MPGNAYAAISRGKQILRINVNRKIAITRRAALPSAPLGRLGEQILDRVRRFRSSSARAKLRRFQMTETEAAEFVNKFVERQLNDTRYASRVAAKYLGLLYGGKVDAEHTLKVRVTSGEVTAQLRRAWLLNRVLNDGSTAAGGERPKTRDDHRHHAVDAIAIALTDDGAIQQLSLAARRATEQGRRKLASVEGPWPNFVDTVREEINRVVVSHRVSKKVSGALHEETLYAAVGAVDGNGARRVRKPLQSLTKAELQTIADSEVKRLVLARLVELGAAEPKKVFSDPNNLPCFVARDGRRIPIKKVRIEKSVPTEALGQGRTVRHVTSESNHHVEIYAEIKPDGSEARWDAEVVSMLEAHRRKREGKAVVQRDHGPLVQFKFSLAPGEVIECDSGDGRKRLLVVLGSTQEADSSPRVFLVDALDARQKTSIKASGGYLRPRVNTLRKWHARKVVVSPLGEVADAHD